MVQTTFQRPAVAEDRTEPARPSKPESTREHLSVAAVNLMESDAASPKARPPQSDQQAESNAGLRMGPIIDKQTGEPILQLRVLGENGSFISQDKDGNVEQIDYGRANKIRNFMRGPDGQLSEIWTIAQENGKRAESVIHRDQESKKWYTEVDGRKFYLPGAIELRPNGDLATEAAPGVWDVETRGSETFREKANLSGARVGLNDGGAIRHIARPDGTMVMCHHLDGKMFGVDEYKADGSCTKWRREGEGWQSNDKPPRERRSMEVQANGVVSFEDSDGKKLIVRGSGEQIAGNNKYEFDSEGRISAVEFADGTTLSDIKYRQGSNEIQSLKHKKKDSQEVSTFERQSGNTWSVTDGKGQRSKHDWHGDLALRPDGSYAWRDDETRNGQKPDGLWNAVKSDGQKVKEMANADGSLSVLDQNKRPLHLERGADGTTLDCQYEGEQLKRVVDTDAMGGGTVWTYSAEEKVWQSTNGEVATKLAVQQDGTLKYETELGQFTRKTDGTTALLKAGDKALVEFNNVGQVVSVTAANGDRRAFEYDEKGLAKVTDSTRRGATSVWDYYKQDSGAERSNMEVKADGTFTYQLPDGSRVVELTDSSKVTFNPGGQLTRVTQTDGATRQFKYDERTGELRTVTDTRVTSQGTRCKDWDAVRQADGTLNLVHHRPDGKTETRTNVRLEDTGSYVYRDAQGKERMARAGQLRRDGDYPWSSEDTDEARDNLLEAMRSSAVSDQRVARMERMMKDFEKREKDLLEMRQELGDDTTRLEEEFSREIAKTYEHLTELVTNKTAGTFYDHDTRVKLAENFMFHCADPATMDQGGKGTCWIQAGHIVGMIDHPDAMARLTKEISLTGTFTSLNSGENDGRPKVFDFNKKAGMLNIGGRNSGANWSIDNAAGSGSRSPVGMIFDESLSLMAGRWRSDGGGYGTTRHLLYMVTGDVVPDTRHNETESLLRHGGYISYAPGHMRSRHLRKEGDQWVIIQDDQHGERSDRTIAIIDNLKDFHLRHAARRASGGVRHHLPDQQGDDSPFKPTDRPYQEDGERRPWRRRPRICRIFG